MATEDVDAKKSGILPKIGSVKYHLLLGAVAIFILGPLGGITAAYMNFSLGFFVGGQVLAGILGSVVTYGYGPEGKHGANYMQTMAASVASMAAMGALIQAMIWIGIPIPEAWKLVVYFLCIGMFGVGVGMLYTPILVDRLQLTYPSGLAVANILRALTDKRLLKRSVGQLVGGTGGGLGLSLLAEKVQLIGAIHFSASSLGAGMIVGARIGIPAIVIGAIGVFITPWLRTHGYLAPETAGSFDFLALAPGQTIAESLSVSESLVMKITAGSPGAPFRKIGFLVALGTIMGAAIVDLSIIFYTAYKRLREKSAVSAAVPNDNWKASNNRRLILWVVFWAAAVLVVATQILHLNAFFVAFAIVLTFLFVLVNGISQGISDSNPISSAFVVTVVLMTALGLKDPAVGLMAAAILLIATSVGCDMQQDRSTGWRLGTNRIVQFRYQVIGITMGAVLAVVMAKVFMEAYPVLKVNLLAHPETKADGWQSAMTYKFVGALEGITSPDPVKTKLLALGLGIGFVTEFLRKILKANARYKAFKESGKVGFATDFVLDSFILMSPYASSFGGFVDFFTSLYFGLGGILSSALQTIDEKRKKGKPKVVGDEDLPEDMSSTSLVGGGLIAGESLAALILGIVGLLALLK